MRAKNILVVTYWSFENALIQTYTLPYVRQIKKFTHGGKIYLFTLSQSSPGLGVKKQIQELAGEGISVISFQYKKFGPTMLLKMAFVFKYLFFLCLFRNISCIHAWCTPGGAIGYLLSIFTGKKLVLDSFEPHAETMVEGNTWSKNSLAYRLLFHLEKKQLQKAEEVICATHGMIRHSQALYGIAKARYFVKPACVDLGLFNYNKTLTDKTIKERLKSNVCVYAGKFGGIYLEQEVFDFFKTCYDYWKGDFSLLLLTSHSDTEVLSYCQKSGFPPEAVVKKFVEHKEVPAYMSLATFGFTPVKPLPSKQFCTPIKDGEYWAMGLPVVITRNISDDSEIIAKNNIGYVLQNLNTDEFLNAAKKIEELGHNKNLKELIRRVAINERNFENAEKIYKTIYA